MNVSNQVIFGDKDTEKTFDTLLVRIKAISVLKFSKWKL